MSLMLLKDFFQMFPDENSCENYLKGVREEVGVVCPKCGATKYKWLYGRRSFQCETCGNRIPLTKGTVMEHSKLSLYDWFFTAHMMTSIKQVLSAKEIQHQLELEYYPPAWLMMMKLRDIMGQRDSIYQLSEQIELDLSYFPTSFISEEGGEKILKTKQTPVLVIAQSKDADSILGTYLSDNTDTERFNKASKLIKQANRSKVKKAVRYIKMYALPNSQYKTLAPYVEKSVVHDSKIDTDGGHNLISLKKTLAGLVQHVQTESSPHEVVTKVLPWVHIVTGECRSGIDAIHKEIDERFLQLYLNEYCWKFNRRWFRDSKKPEYDLFRHLMKTAVQYKSSIKWHDYEVYFERI